MLLSLHDYECDFVFGPFGLMISLAVQSGPCSCVRVSRVLIHYALVILRQTEIRTIHVS